MRIEKVNDNQIRCTLTKEDLADRQLKLSELAYGTEKAKTLFRDMMQQANAEFGFEAENIPLMIEAVPVSADTIILIITKVEYPEELDTRFSQFSPASEDDLEESDDNDSENVPTLEGAEDILNLFKKLKSDKSDRAIGTPSKKDFVPLEHAIKKATEEKKENFTAPVDLAKLFVFNQLDDITRSARILCGFYHGTNDLYRNSATKKYYLFIHKSDHSPEEFNKVCNILSEYSSQEKYTKAAEAYYAEHFKTIVSPDAIQVLGTL